MQMKIMEEVESNMKQLKQEFQEKQKSSHINDLVSKQDQDLNERRAKRRKNKRKKSADMKQVVVVEEAPIILKEDLMAVQAEINQTYERFTRLT